jgi:2-oxoglutarate ferredoxin oxidoreductase subunit alpha
MSRQIKFIQGNEACVEGALYAGLDFFAGYPITPSTEIAEHLSKRLPQIGGKFIQMEDEIASMCAIIGASLTGTRCSRPHRAPGFRSSRKRWATR